MRDFLKAVLAEWVPGALGLLCGLCDLGLVHGELRLELLDLRLELGGPVFVAACSGLRGVLFWVVGLRAGTVISLPSAGQELLPQSDHPDTALPVKPQIQISENKPASKSKIDGNPKSMAPLSRATSG